MMSEAAIRRKYDAAQDFIESKKDEVTLDHDVAEAAHIVKILEEVLLLKKQS